MTTDVEHMVYRFFDQDGALLYVGLSRDLPQRLRDHANNRPWWPDVASVTADRYPSHDAAAVAEVEGIVTESPLYNVSTALHVASHRPVLAMKSHRFPAELYETAKARAYERRVSLSDVLRAALEEFVKEDDS